MKTPGKLGTGYASGPPVPMLRTIASRCVGAHHAKFFVLKQMVNSLPRLRGEVASNLAS